ncbi:DENN domain-containing protein 5B [Mizuhopecten yessoensis]|uniref:DENN domain-containing protein 5B n=1 Tax=Mizuhopecten yessoensis TaxID=6573 RepID=A0A210PY02_MIZYE|nr:DENN domain-containing protein 5B [Mizuhopecten yessoensis]
MTNQGNPSRFADYFVVCGLDVGSGLEPDTLSGDNLQCPPLDRPFKSKVLLHFPQSVPWSPFDKDAVGMLSLPKGLIFRTQKDSHRPKFHSFIITKEDGSRNFGSAFTFYEEVNDRKISAAMQTLQHMYQAEVASCSMDSGRSSRDTSPRPGHHQRQTSPRDSARIYDPQKDKLFVTKTICLITQMPFVRASRQFLRQLYEAVSKPSETHLPLESYIYNILYEVPLPPPGRSLKFYGVEMPIFCQRPSVSELPLFDFSLWDLFRSLEVRDIIQLFTSVLLEHQILIYASDYQRLMLVAECMNTLVFPFAWQHVYVPILPASLTHFLDAPVPFIMGLHHGRENRSELELPSEANMCFVDLDEKTVDVPEELPRFPHLQELTEELINVCSIHRTRLYREKVETAKTDPAVNPKQASPRRSLSKEDALKTNKMEILQQSEAFAKISALAKKTGVWSSIEEFSDMPSKDSKEAGSRDPSSMSVKEIEDLKFNNTVREIFLNHFLHLFSSYETFVIQPNQDMDAWLNNRESMQNFDKAAFLSDQPEGYLPFLSSFTETQMFTTMVDNKILSQWEDQEPQLRVFDSRLKILKEILGENITHTYSQCTTLVDTETMLQKRVIYIDHVSPKPHSLEDQENTAPQEPGIFPKLDAEILNKEPTAVKGKSREGAKWRRKDRLMQHSEHIKLNSDQREKYMQEARTKGLRQPKLSDMSAASMAQTNWKFVETLLQECKSKTKRMLVDKMGHEAVELGHGNITGVEENTLIASLCDLLERIWGHGIQFKKGKSALWSHLKSFQELEECNQGNKFLDTNLLSPDMSGMSITDGTRSLERKTHRRKGSTGRIELPTLNPLPSSITFDLRKVQQMTEIRTDVGYARAWIRLALEKKVLSAHLKILLSNIELLRSLYKRYAFLRCEDEREQFLYHLLSLNAVDYSCFTNSFTNTMVPYKILIYPCPKFGCSTTSANPWINLAGQAGETGVTEIPKGLLEFNLEHKNLGVLTTLRIGHDNSGMTPRWLVDYVLVRNDLTGHVYKFNCGRWLGKGVDDGSTERLLVAEIIPKTSDMDGLDLAVLASSSPRSMSPNSPKKSSDQNLKIPMIQEMLGHAINNLVKHYYKPEKERGSLTFLLCGDRGLVHCMELVFQSGFRSSRLFRNKFFIWDYLEKVKGHFECVLSGEVRRPMSEGAKAGYWLFCNILSKINSAAETVGKDGKFQIFVCVGIRDHVIQKMLPLIANTPVTATMFEEHSFFRDPSLTNYLVHILGTLDEFHIVFDSRYLSNRCVILDTYPTGDDIHVLVYAHSTQHIQKEHCDVLILGEYKTTSILNLIQQCRNLNLNISS